HRAQAGASGPRGRGMSTKLLAEAALPPPGREIGPRVAALDWERIGAELDAEGAATTGPLLTAAECTALAALYDEENRFRSKVIMARHGFGRGEYQYFSYPLPPLVAGLRGALYAALAPVANRWSAAMG